MLEIFSAGFAILGVTIALISVGITLVALIASAIFYFKSAKQLKVAINIFGGFLEGEIKEQNISFRRNKKGDIVGLSIIARVGGAKERENIGETIVRILKKADKKESD